MNNQDYMSLWEINDSRTYMVLRANDEREFGYIVVAPGVDAMALHARGVERAAYPEESFLVEIVDDFDGMDGVDIN